MKIKRKLLILFYLFVFPLYCFSQDNTTNNTEQINECQNNSDNLMNFNYNVQNLNQNSNEEYQNVNQFNNNSNQSNQTSMTLQSFLNDQDELLNQLGLQFQDLITQVQTLSKLYNDSNLTNQQLNFYVQSCKTKIQNLEENLNQFREALISNKEDTSEVIELLGEMQETLDLYTLQLAKYESQIRNSAILHNIEMPLCFVSGAMTCLGAYEWIANDKDWGKYLCIAGGSIFIGFEISYNVGHIIFKWW